VLGLTGLSLGLICVGTADETIFSAMLAVLSEKSETKLKEPNMKLLALGTALLCLGILVANILFFSVMKRVSMFAGKQQRADSFIETMKVLKPPFGKMVSTLVEIAAYTGSGNVLKIQQLLQICSQHYVMRAQCCV